MPEVMLMQWHHPQDIAAVDEVPIAVPRHLLQVCDFSVDHQGLQVLCSPILYQNTIA